jgi:hypothetical protein
MADSQPATIGYLLSAICHQLSTPCPSPVHHLPVAPRAPTCLIFLPRQTQGVSFVLPLAFSFQDITLCPLLYALRLSALCSRLYALFPYALHLEV